MRLELDVSNLDIRCFYHLLYLSVKPL